jgi:hypothetical protein
MISQTTVVTVLVASLIAGTITKYFMCKDE